MTTLWTYLFAWMPPALSIFGQILLVLITVYIVLRIVSIVLSAIPFL